MDDVIERIKAFNKERHWGRFHTPRNLATSLVLEAAEVVEKFQWKLDDKLSKEERAELKEELADVFMYTLQLANRLKIDLLKAAHEKIDKNGLKYPVEKSKGKSTKYNKL